MTLKEARAEARARGLKGYSTITLAQVEQLLRGEKVLKYRKNQRSVETQTETVECQACALQTVLSRMREKADLEVKKKRVIVDGDLEFDADTGEEVGCAVDYSRYW
jgi:hypothetical protein